MRGWHRALAPAETGVGNTSDHPSSTDTERRLRLPAGPQDAIIAALLWRLAKFSVLVPEVEFCHVGWRAAVLARARVGEGEPIDRANPTGTTSRIRPAASGRGIVRNAR